MSAIPVYEPITEPVVVRPRPTYTAQTVAIPVAVPRRRSRTRTIDLTEVLGMCVSFLIIAGLTCFVASLMGNVMVEKARRDGIRSMERARFAARESAAIREQVQTITSAKAIDDWANSKGFVAAADLAKPSGH